MGEHGGHVAGRLGVWLDGPAGRVGESQRCGGQDGEEDGGSGTVHCCCRKSFRSWRREVFERRWAFKTSGMGKRAKDMPRRTGQCSEMGGGIERRAYIYVTAQCTPMSLIPWRYKRPDPAGVSRPGGRAVDHVEGETRFPSCGACGRTCMYAMDIRLCYTEESLVNNSASRRFVPLVVRR